MKKQTVYIPVTIYENHNTGIIVKHIHSGHKYPVNKETGYFFTEEQLNELLSNVIKDTLDTASEKAEIRSSARPRGSSGAPRSDR